jgi:hypothetical protein
LKAFLYQLIVFDRKSDLFYDALNLDCPPPAM